MTPEEKARQKIDQWFAEAGWKVINREDYEPTCTAVAIREGLLKGNLEADYFLFINGKAVDVLEAKREDIDAHSDKVCEQAVLYANSVPHIYQAYQKPLPFIFTSNGKELYFCDFREQEQGFKQIIAIPTPYELVKQLGISDYFAGLPTLRKKGLRDCQYEAVTELEKSFHAGQNRVLMVLATGAGKTYTACLAAYRLLSYTPMRRILFLVDRNNLGKQAEGEFGTFRLTENGEAFNTIFTVNRLRSSSIPSDSNVIISTIQRLFSFLKGDTIEDSDEDDDNEPTEEITLPPNPNLPHDYFDLIIIDECHRSIYGNWRKVLEYFDTARLIGLTATPVPETMAFFNNNRIVNYTLEKSIVDGVNVDCRVYRIKTQVTENGGAILEREKVKEETRYTGDIKTILNKKAKTYTNKELNRSVINPAQIKLVLSTYRDAVYTELFNDPQREANFDWLTKTLIFALNETHATNIVQIAKEVFGRTDNRFVQKITYSAGDSNELIRQFRNDRDFCIAVTCTLVATGTDIKPLEVVMFMRDVESLPLYIQMKGRGVRTIGDEQLRNVTPNAFSKDCFYLVDAVGVTEHEKTIPLITDEPTTKIISLKELSSVDNVILICEKGIRPKSKINYIDIRDCLSNLIYKKEITGSVYQNTILPPSYNFEIDINKGNTIINKVEQNPPLKLFAKSYFGIQTIDRKAYVSHIKRDEHYLPVIDGVNILPYILIPSSEFVNFIPSAIKSGGKSQVYNQERIVVRQIGAFPEGCICPSGLYTLNTIYNIYLWNNRLSLKYILGLINSKLIHYYRSLKYSDSKKTFPKIKKEPLDSIPICEPSNKDICNSIISFVDRIMVAKDKDRNADTSLEERQIDRLVYHLYGLTYDEVLIVDPQTPITREEYEN